jgi:hypothetical protein
VQHKVGKHKPRTYFHSVKRRKNAEANKKINPIQVIGIWLTNTFPESKISPENLIIKEI